MIVGAGYIALELGSMLCALGVDVTLVHRGEEILRGFDHDLRCHLHDELEGKGMRIVLETQVTEIRKTGSAFEALLDSGELLETDFPIFAIGREPNVEGLGLQELGVELGQRGGVVVDDNYSSSVPSIHAVGDVIDHIQLTPVAVAEGMHFAHHFYGHGEHRIDYASIPTAVFCQPELATVGLTEKRGLAPLSGRACLQVGLHSLEARAERTKRAHDRQARGGRFERSSGWLPHGRPRSGGDHPGPRGGHQGGRNQGPVRRDHRDTPDRGRGIRHPAIIFD